MILRIDGMMQEIKINGGNKVFKKATNKKNIMKILLIDANVATSPYPVYPLGMSIIAKALLNAGHEVIQFDFLQQGQTFDLLKKKLINLYPDIIGISIRNIDNVNILNEQRYIDIIKKIVDEIKSVTNVPTILGGTAFSIMPEKILAYSGADYGIAGEGEKLIVDLVKEIGQKRIPYKTILKSDFQLQGKQIYGAFYNTEIMSYYLKEGSIANIQTKRGCPHKCIYCSYPHLEGDRVRTRDIKDVINDIEYLIKQHNIKMLFFTDSIFNDEQGYYVELLNEMEKQNIYIPWAAYIRPGYIENSVLKLMIKTGVRGVELGSDGPTDNALKWLGKSFRFQDVLDCNKVFANNNIATANFFMFGGPRETEQSIQDGIDNIIDFKKTVCFMFMGIRILPNTLLHNLAVKQKMITEDTDLLSPVYYISPKIDKKWLKQIMEKSFKPYQHCVFPPDIYERKVKFLQRRGYTGLMWDLLLDKKRRKTRSWKKDNL